MCISNNYAHLNTFTLDANGKITYALVSPALEVAMVGEGCSTVEARAKANGNVFARVVRGHVIPRP